jgi:hypothetical protein
MTQVPLYDHVIPKKLETVCLVSSEAAGRECVIGGVEGGVL